MSTDQLRQALRDVDFPVGKDELIRAAQASGAPGEVIRALRAIPPEEYANREEVARSVGLSMWRYMPVNVAIRAPSVARWHWLCLSSQ
jgi:hypothetical protein